MPKEAPTMKTIVLGFGSVLGRYEATKGILHLSFIFIFLISISGRVGGQVIAIGS